jgi:hypothetical protein
MNLGLFLLAAASLLLVSRVFVPWARPVEGRVLRRLPVPLRARLHRLIVPLAAMAAILAYDLARGWLPEWAALPALLLIVFVLAAPARYTISDQGIAVGLTPFRRWTEFGGLSVRRGRIRLKAISGLSGLDVWLPGRFEDAEVVTEFRRLLRDAYKGGAAPAVEPPTAPIADEPIEPADVRVHAGAG